MQKLNDLRYRELVASVPNEFVHSAAVLMEDKGVGCVVVISDGKVVGIATRYDFIHHIIVRGKDARTTKIEEIMHSSPVTIDASVYNYRSAP